MSEGASEKLTRSKVILSLLPLLVGVVMPLCVYLFFRDSSSSFRVRPGNSAVGHLALHILVGSCGFWLLIPTLFLFSEHCKEKLFAFISIVGLFSVTATDIFRYVTTWSRGWSMLGVMSAFEGLMASIVFGLLSGSIGIGLGFALYMWLSKGRAA